MSNNLFSVFEPSAFLNLSLNWLSLSCFVLIPSSFLMSPHYCSLSLKNLSRAVNLNSKDVLSPTASPVSGLFLLSLLVWVILNNFLGLGPYMFTASSHLVFGMSLGMTAWVGYMGIYFFYFNDELMSHLIPTGTPVALVVLMIFIESVSNLIRPVTLMFRLTANMIAGHLLIVLLSNSALSDSLAMLTLVLSALILLLLLEVSVSFIQAYVFYLLTSLYLSDLVSTSSSRSQLLSQAL